MAIHKRVARGIRPICQHLLALSLVAVAMVGIAHYFILERFEQRVLEAQALRAAEIVVQHALASRTTYEELARSLRATGKRANVQQAPPIQYLERTAADVNRRNGGLYTYKALSRRSEESDGVSLDDFERWGWEQLESRQPAWRFDGAGQDRMLRYMHAVPALDTNGTIGALEVQMPLRSVGADGVGRSQLLLALAASSLGIGLAGYWAWLGARRERCERDHSETALLLRTTSLHSALGDTKKALDYALAALTAARRSRLPRDIAAAEECLGDVLCAEGRIDEGAGHWRASLQLLRNDRQYQQAARLCEKLAGVSVDKGAGADAVRWRRRATELELKAIDSGVTPTPSSDFSAIDVGDERWRSAEMAFHTAKMAAVGRMVAGVNHELKQPLVSLRLLAASVLERLDRGETDHVRRNLYDMVAMTDQIARLTAALDNFSRKQPYQPAPSRMSACIRGALRVLGPQLNERERDIVVRGVDPEVWLDHDRVRLILVNLLSNAVDATANAADKRIEIDIREEGTSIAVRIRDFGHGFPAEVQQHLFDMFVTTKAEGRGLGLGLALCAKMSREMGGTLSGRNHPQGGAEFTLCLPLSSK